MNSASPEPAAIQSWLTAIALTLALVLGGGGSPAPLPEMILQLAFAGVFALWLWKLPAPLAAMAPRGALLIAALIVALPLLQLIPLPPALWQALPGRALERDVLALVDAEDSWRPLTIAPARTLAALLAMAPAAAMLVMAAALGRRGRLRLVQVVLIAGVASLLVGALQLSSGVAGPLRFYEPDSNYLQGFQANHNSTADILLIALLAAPLAVRSAVARGILPGKPLPVFAAAGLLALLMIIGVVLTASRFGMLLLPVALLGGAVILRPWFKRGLRTGVLAVVLASLLAAGGWSAASRIPALNNALARFELGEEGRPEIWRDSFYAAQRLFPTGSGMGTFLPAYLAGERLETVSDTIPNRAHNDYLELAIEAGLPGMAIFSLIVATLGQAALATIRSNGANPPGLTAFALFALVLLGLHSLVDYPFRSMALACLGAACAGMLFSPRSARSDQAHPEEVTEPQ